MGEMDGGMDIHVIRVLSDKYVPGENYCSIAKAIPNLVGESTLCSF